MSRIHGAEWRPVEPLYSDPHGAGRSVEPGESASGLTLATPAEMAAWNVEQARLAARTPEEVAADEAAEEEMLAAVYGDKQWD